MPHVVAVQSCSFDSCFACIQSSIRWWLHKQRSHVLRGAGSPGTTLIGCGGARNLHAIHAGTSDVIVSAATCSDGFQGRTERDVCWETMEWELDLLLPRQHRNHSSESRAHPRLLYKMMSSSSATPHRHELDPSILRNPVHTCRSAFRHLNACASRRDCRLAESGPLAFSNGRLHDDVRWCMTDHWTACGGLGATLRMQSCAAVWLAAQLWMAL